MVTLFCLLLSFIALSSTTSTETLASADASWYAPNGHLGSCGKPISNAELAVAMGMSINGDHQACGRKIRVDHDGKSIVVTVMDSCGACDSLKRIDLTEGAFEQLGSTSAGLLPVTWEWV